MASYMSTFRSRLRKLEKQGFIIPKYIKDIKREKTARKYSYASIAEKSKFKDIFTDAEGKQQERIVSGGYGLEKLRSKSAQKASRTRLAREFEKWKKEVEQYDDSGITADDWEWAEEPSPEDEVQDWEDRKNQLKRNIDAIFNSFSSSRLAGKLKWLFDKRDKEDGKVFWDYLLDHEYFVIEKLQEDAFIPSDAPEEEEDQKYNEWYEFLNYGEASSTDDRKDMSD